MEGQVVEAIEELRSLRSSASRADKLEKALQVMVAVFRPRDGEPGPDQHVETEAYALALDALGDAAPSSPEEGENGN